MTLQEKIAVMEAVLDGEQIQFRNTPGPRSELWTDNVPEWTDICGRRANFNFGGYEYRVKPQPREFWINFYPEGRRFLGVAEYVHRCADSARIGKGADASVETIRVREVLD